MVGLRNTSQVMGALQWNCNQSMALTPEQVYKPFSTEIKLITYYFDSYLRDHAQILS